MIDFKITIQKAENENWLGMIHEKGMTYNGDPSQPPILCGGDTIHTLMANLAKTIEDKTTSAPVSVGKEKQ